MTKQITKEQERTTDLWHHFIAVEGLSEREARRRMDQIKKSKAKMEKALRDDRIKIVDKMKPETTATAKGYFKYLSEKENK